MFEFPFLKKCLYVFIILALLAAGSVLVRRVVFEQKLEKVELVYSYRELKRLAQATGQDTTAVLDWLKQTQITAIVLEEDTLEQLEVEGKAFLWSGGDLLKRQTLGGIIPKEVRADRYYVFVPDEGRRSQVLAGLKAELGNALAQPLAGSPWIEVAADKDEIELMGLGIEAADVQFLREKGFRILPRLKQVSRISSADISYKLSTLDSIPTPSTVIFEGTQIVGYSAYLADIKKALIARNFAMGYLEFVEQVGAPQLAASMPTHVYRVHSVPEAELLTLSPQKTIDRYVRANKERKVPILFLHPFLTTVNDPKFKGDLWQLNHESLASLEQELSKAKVSIGPVVWPWASFTPITPLEIVLLGLGLIGVSLWIYSAFAPLTLRLVFAKTVGLGVLVALIAPLDRWSDLAKLLALGYTVMVPIGVALWLRDAFVESPNRGIWPCVQLLGKATVGILVGGCCVAALLTSPALLQNIAVFGGVKIAIVAGLLGSATVMYFSKAQWRSGTILLANWAKKPMPLLGMVILGGAAAVVGVFLMRSGNHPGSDLPASELFLRSTLERVFGIRPRTKEFLVGYPIFVAGFLMLGREIPKALAWLVYTLGAIALVSMMNSFCHAHTPFLVTVYRSAVGVLLGLMLGLVAVAGIRILKHGYSFFSRR
ncbi:MAG: DUF5693 family protein [Candidatus Margulisiibacteriota bacterium]